MLKKVIFSKTERDFLRSHEACRIATCHDNIPHVVPVSYVFKDNTFYIATDYKTKKYKNITKNNKIALAVDVYNSVENKAICIQGRVKVVENGRKFKRLYKIFHDRFEWVKREPWKENEAPFLCVTPQNKVSWGL